MFTLAHISDLHVDGGERARGRVRAVMSYLDGFAGALDAVVATGDLTDHGTPQELAEVRGLLAGRLPVLTCPGNHDVPPQGRAAYRRVLGGGGGGPVAQEAVGEAPLNAVHRTGRGTVVLVDSTLPGEGGGRLAPVTLAWLEAVLAEQAEGPVVLALHHPPVPLHMPAVDGIGLANAADLAALVERHPRVAALLCGHAHTPAATMFAGRPLLAAPAAVWTAPLPWEDAERVYGAHPPMVAFHVVGDDGRVTSHFRVVPEPAPAAG
ncbi:metallophosphoesterase [Streptomonospora sp. S1-112]|uniref:Metallophosphoesterase n=1 Tax=Streptomonospora mangrovi TaxID=2883123 RepID=A0A9X3NKH5_9ACTN|nr:metallophosphoesterase [Streptomonospora mangrovi]MDA0563469.1 metallophosphoesterase [Streptomonospora mangrovi]